MEAATKYYKEHYEIINYIIIAFLLALSCFAKFFCFVVVVFAVLFSILNNFKQNIKLLVFMYPFQVLYTNAIASFNLVYICFAVVLIAKYIIELAKKKKKLNAKLLIGLSVFAIYLLFPMHKVIYYDFLKFLLIFAYIYLIFEYRRELDFAEIAISFSCGLIVCCFYSLFAFISPYLKGIIPKVLTDEHLKMYRFSGLLTHPNNLATNGMIALTSLFTCFYLKKIKLSHFCLLISPLYIFCFLTISRLFIVSFAVLLLVFTIIYAIKFKKQAVKPILIIYATIFACSLTLIYPAKFYLSRLNQGTTLENMNFDDATMQQIYEGKIQYDPGRLGLWKLYLTDWASSAKTILFGRGISKAKIGQMAAHNAFIHFLWFHGIIGCLLAVGLLASLINFKKLNKQKIILATMLLPVIVTFMLDPLWATQRLLAMIMLFSTFSIKQEEDRTEISIKQEDKEKSRI